ncbi:GNAT family N-acetyltransferase [Streptomyces albidoflavus]|uniref:GNAT family N-acetyltransferase n=1 Tax=Streptomyces TaxID=1883 RepID=UPI00063ECF30|nr:GNAT family N-acetyltransferase [Streptomyces sp. KE1]KLJ02280.1 acetyltransferase [Streptomyces sp. KE1]
MTITVRDFRPEDAEAVVRVLREAIPPLLTTAEAQVWEREHTAEAARQRLLVAEVDGEVVGRCQTGLAHESPTPGNAYVNTYVRPDRRGRGAGTALVAAAEAYLREVGAERAYSWVLGDEKSLAYAGRHGYAARRSAHFLRLDLTAPLPPLPEVPAGVELVDCTAFADDPRPVFDLDAAVTADEPSDVGAELDDYAEWLVSTWGHPCQSRELATLALVDGRPVAFSAVVTDGVSRMSSAMTGTLREYRGRGLATLAKTATLHKARAAGLREAFTGNDAENAPMLAVNRKFGYEICATEVRHVRELG